MTLDEAIKHAEEVAEGHEKIKCIKAVTLEECKCAEEHRQLAGWLKELKALREVFIRASEALEQEPCDCRSCKKWDECPCGKEGHENGTSISYSVGKCRDYEQEDILDKIRAEIKEHADRLKDSLYGDGMRHCIDIIDKYKAESEIEE